MIKQFHFGVSAWKKPRNQIYIYIHTLIVIAALFTIAKICNQPKCPSVDEWIKKDIYTYIMAYYIYLAY